VPHGSPPPFRGPHFPAVHALTAGAALLVLPLFLCAAILSGTVSTTDAQPGEATLFTEGYQAYVKGDTDKAIATFNGVLKQYPNGKVNDLVLYWLGKSYQKAGRTQEAIATFRELKAKHPRSSMYGHASRLLAALEKAPAEKAPAAPETKPAVKPIAPKPAPAPEPPPKAAAAPKLTPPAKPEAPPQVGKKEPPTSVRQKAIESYERIIREAPDTPEAVKARERLAELRGGAKPAPGRPGRVPPAKAPKRSPLAAPPAGETVFLVVERVASVEVSEVRANYVATSGETIAVPFVVANRGNSEDAFQLTSTLPPSFQPAFFHDVEGTGQVRAEEPSVTETLRLGIGEKARFVLRARVPVEMSDGFAQEFEVKATSKSDPAVSQAAPTALVASAPSLRGTLSVDRTSVKPGDTLSYTLSLTNAGSADTRSARLVVTYPGALRLTGAAPSSTSMDPELHTATWELVRMPPQDRRAVRLDFRVGNDALADQDIVIRALLQSPVGEQTVSVVSAVAKVEAVAGVRVVGAEALSTVFPRETVYLPFTVRNTGNGPDRFALRTQSDLGAGVALVEDRNRDGLRQPNEPEVERTRLLNPQEEIGLLAELAVPSDAMDAKQHAVRLVATSERSRSVVSESGRLLVVSRPVVVVATQIASKEGIPGKVFSYQLVCTNTGTSPAKRVLVSESLPPELEFVDAQPRPGQIEGQRLAWEIADLGSGQQEILTVGVRVKAGIAAGTPVRKTTMVRYRDLRDQVYESSPIREGQ
jgi:uncharacterized repeat protein (TIGR01451 family)